MNDLMKPVTDEGAKRLLALIKQLVKEKQYEGVELLFSSSKNAERNLQYLPKIAMDIYHEVCMENLNEQNNHENPQLYSCAEELLKIVASYAPAEELLLELLELVEDNKSEYVFTSALKALQIVLLRQGDEKPRALEWSLNSVYTRLEDLPLPECSKEEYDANQQRLLEQCDQVQSLLMHYITVGLFYDPLLNVICSQHRGGDEIFRPLGITRRNVLCCFLIQLLGKPLSLLDLTNDEESKTNTYSLQCAKSATQGATKCISDPLFLLSFVESRARFKRGKDEGRGIHEVSSSNIFLIDEKLRLDCLAIYYYMIFVGKVDIEHVPLVYHPLYILESCLYLIYELLLQDEPALHAKGLFLMEKLLQNLQHNLISVSSLELEIHKSICTTLCNIVGYSGSIKIRQVGLKVLRQYIISFEDEGKYLILKNLLQSVNHHGIGGYLATLYKDLVAEALKNPADMPASFCGNDFRYLMSNICQLPHGIKTDVLENSDKIISSLNALRYFAIRDVENRTGFWNFAADIELSYLSCLRKALDFSVAHFKGELHRVESGTEYKHMSQLNLLDIDVVNDNKQSKLDLEFDREKKTNILNGNLCTFDLIRSLLARACECLENIPESIKNKECEKILKC